MATFLRLPEVIARIGLSRSTIYELAARGEFPRQVKLGPRSSAWVEEEIATWIDRRLASRQVNQPSASGVSWLGQRL